MNLEHKVDNLEKDLIQIKEKVGHLEKDVAQINQRVGHLESDVSQIKIDVTAIKVRLDIELPQFATKADYANLRGELKADIADAKSSIIQWMVGTLLASAGLAATISFGLTQLLK